MITTEGSFPWDNFCIKIDNRRIFLCCVRNCTYDNDDIAICYYPYTTEWFNLHSIKPKNLLLCVGDFNSFLFDSRKYSNLVYVSTYCFHYYPEFENTEIKNEELIYDGIIVARNDNDKKRHLISKLKDYKILSASPDLKHHIPIDFKFVKYGKFSSMELSTFYRQSKCSFMFSEREGECRSVMESLLSGCPVISTKPKKWVDGNTIFNDMPMNGGRAELLLPTNSLYTEWDEQSVKDTYEKYIDNIKLFDREKIRYDAKQFLFRSRLQLIKILHNIINTHFKNDFMEIILSLKEDKTPNSFYSIFKEPLTYYESIIK